MEHCSMVYSLRNFWPLTNTLQLLSKTYFRYRVQILPIWVSQWQLLLICSSGAFEKFQKAAIGFVMSLSLSVRPSALSSVRPSVRLSDSNGRIFEKFYSEGFFWNCVEKMRVWLNSGKNFRLFTWRSNEVFGISLDSSWNKKSRHYL